MERGTGQVKPGDVIEWVYVNTCRVVDTHETLFSTIERRYTSIGSGMVHILISHDDESLTWLNSDGLFSALISDNLRPPMIIPRKFVFARVNANFSTPEIG